MPKSFSAPHMDPDDLLDLFQAHVSSRDDGGVHASGLDHFQAGFYQAFGVARMFHEGHIRFKKGLGTNTTSAKSLDQLVDLALATRTVEEGQGDIHIGYDLTDKGKDVARWMLEGTLSTRLK